MVVKGATQATVYITAATNYVNYHDVTGNPTAKNEQVQKSLQGRKFEDLLAAHIAKYQAQYGRVSLSLPTSSRSTLPTDRRLAAFAGGSDMDLVALMFQVRSKAGCTALSHTCRSPATR